MTDLTFNTSRTISMVGAAVSIQAMLKVSLLIRRFSQISDMELSFEAQFYSLDFINYSYLSFVFPNEIGKLGISIQQLGVKSLIILIICLLKVHYQLVKVLVY